MQPSSQSLVERTREQMRRLGVWRFWRTPLPPSNLRARDTSPDTIEADAIYGLNTGLAFYNQMRSVGLDPADKDILEVGPGTGFGGVAVLTAFGARGAVADRWLAPWQDDYHGPYYRRLAERLAEVRPDADVRTLTALSDRRGYEGGPIELLAAPAETLHRVTERRFDAVFSNAVLEHVLDIDATMHALSRVTLAGGYGFHQVDFRDHRNFERPLDHLLFEPRTFSRMSRRVHMAYGSQRRPEVYADAFASAGFQVRGYHANSFADDDYLDDLLVRLRNASRSPYRMLKRDELRELGGLYIVERAPEQR